MSSADTVDLEKLPMPRGYKILVAVPKSEDKYGSGLIVKADSTVRNEELMTLVGMVVDMGSEAYMDKAKFPNGEPWCKPGDYILMRSYSGTRFKIGENEFRLINDDAVEAVVPDPKAISRAI